MDDKYMSALKHQHERVHELREQVEAACADYLDDGTDGHWDALVGSFRGLAEHLDRHFSFEEHEGFLVEVVARMPESIDRVKTLREDHDSIRMAFMDWGRVMETSLDAEKRADIAGAGVGKLLETLDDHEKREAAILQEAYLRDPGR